MVIKDNMIFNRLFNELYSPPSLLHRDQEIRKIEKTFNDFFGNLFLVGGTGEGKTASARVAMKNNLNKYLYTSASDKLSTIKIFKKLTETNKGALSSVVENLKHKMIQNPKVLIFDEVDKISNLKDFFDILNSIYRDTRVPMIIISKKADLLNSMPDDAFSTLFFQRVVYKSYDAHQLRDIAMQRINLMEYPNNNFPEDSLNYICAKSVKYGSARTMLYMVYRCLSEKNYDICFVDQLQNEINRQDWEQWIYSLKEFEKTFIKSLIDFSAKNISVEEGNGEITASEIQKILPQLSPQRISQLITTFQSYGLLDTRYENKGKVGGRYRLVSFSNHEIFSRLMDVL